MEAVTSLVEIGVGLACLLGAVATWRRRSLRWLGALLAVLGAAAIAHGILSLVR
jgi:hypothetical protein